MTLAVIDAAKLDELVGRFAATDISGKGAAFVLGFEAIRDRSGPRWTVRQDTVLEFTKRQFQKYFPANDHLVPLDDVNFLLVQPSKNGFGARLRALNLLDLVLQYFLGVRQRADMMLSRVTRISAEGLESTEVEITDADLNRLVGAHWEAGAPATGGHAGVIPRPAPGSVSSLMGAIAARPGVVGMTLGGERNYDGAFVIEPMWSIRRRAVVSYQLRPLIFEQQADGLTLADIKSAGLGDRVRLDLLALAEAQRLFEKYGRDKNFALHVPIYHGSLGGAASRLTILSALDRMQPAASSSILIVLTGLEAGAPHAQIVALTTALAGRCRAVIALAPDLGVRVERWREARLSGVAVDLSAMAKSKDPLGVKRISDFADRFHGVAPALLAYSVSSKAVLLAAWAAGFTHAGGELIDKYCEGMLQPLRLDPIDMYRDAT